MNINMLIRLRLIQSFRLASALGLPRLLILIAILIGFIALIFAKTKLESEAMITLLLSLAILFLLHQSRADQHFVVQNHIHPWRWFLPEYVLLLSPVWVSILLHRHFAVLLLLGLLWPISHYRASIHTKQKPIIRSRLIHWIPSGSFEWKAGIRRTYYLFIFIWVAGLAVAPNLVLLPLSMMIEAILVASFYERNESLPMLTSYELTANQLIKQKIEHNARMFGLLMLPHTLIYMVFHPNFWFVTPLLLLLLILIQSYAIVVKYTFYDPQSGSPANSFFQSLGAVAIIVPMLLPLILLLGIRFYFKSLQNLHPLLDD